MVRRNRGRLYDDAGLARDGRRFRLCVAALAWLALAIGHAATEASAQSCNPFLPGGTQCLGTNSTCAGICGFNQHNQGVCFYPFAGRSCDDGNASTVSDQCDASGNCGGILCGNGVPDGSEQCDDGVANGTSTSCCTTSCSFQPASTMCDDADADTVDDQCDGAGACAGSLCGNGAGDSGEDCDDGAANGTPTSCCTDSCTFQSAGTACDDADASTGNDQCDAAGLCAGVPCGNGSDDSGEDCDDGAANGTSTSCCAANCTFQPASTSCDDSDGNTVGDQCDGAGTCAGSLCGNGGDDGSEQCDEGVANGTPASCCTASCTFRPADTMCDDGNASTLNDSCDASGACGGDTELVVNGDFEGGSTSGVADGWQAKRLLTPPDRVGCGTSCFVELVGNGSSKKYYQLNNTAGSAGDSFTLTVRSRARSVPDSGGPYMVKVTIFHSDGSTERFGLEFSAGTHGYETVMTDFMASENYNKIKIKILFGKTVGTVRFDDVSLLRH